MESREILTSIKKHGISKIALAASRAIASHDFVLFCLVLFILSESFKTQQYLSLFVYDQVLVEWRRNIASSLNAVVFECLQLLFTINQKLLFRRISLVQAIITFINNFIYYQVWSFGPDDPKLYVKGFIAIGFAFISFVLTELYLKRWTGIKYRLAKRIVSVRLTEHQQKLDKQSRELADEAEQRKAEKQALDSIKQQLAGREKELAAQLQQIAGEKQKLTEQSQKVSKQKQQLSTVQAETSTLEAKKLEIEKWIKEHSCPACGHPLHGDFKKSYAAHKPHCIANQKPEPSINQKIRNLDQGALLSRLWTFSICRFQKVIFRSQTPLDNNSET